MPENEIVVRRTGEVFSMSSNEFEVTYPDGHVGKIWSPPCHELSDAEEEAAARAVAAKFFAEGVHKDSAGKVTTADPDTPVTDRRPTGVSG